MGRITKIDQKEKLIELRAKGYSFNEIAKEIGLSKPTLIKWSNELQMEIANRKALEIDALQEKYFVSWKKRVEAFGEQLHRIQSELKERDLSDIHSKELIDLQIKFLEKLKEEQIQIKLKQKGDGLQGIIENMNTEEWSV